MSIKLVKSSSSGPDQAEFRIPASDTKGHSARQWFRCIPSMARQVEQIVQAKQFPYRTKGDLLRHALHQHMRWLASLEPLKTVSGQVDAILEIMRDEEMNKDFSLVFARLEERISSYVEDGDNREAARLVLIVQSHIKEMPSGFWKDKYQKKVKDQFGGLLKKATKLKLGDLE